MQVVWFKRDLRIVDHRPLAEASRKGPVLCLYVYEPELFASAGFGALQLQFINESLQELRERLRALGADLAIRVGSMPDVLEALRRQHGVTALHSHRETGNRVSYERDLRVAAWARHHGIPWRELNQFGVIRRLKSRDGWAARWARSMSRPMEPAPERLVGHRDVEPGRGLGVV